MLYNREKFVGPIQLTAANWLFDGVRELYTFSTGLFGHGDHPIVYVLHGLLLRRLTELVTIHDELPLPELKPRCWLGSQTPTGTLIVVRRRAKSLEPSQLERAATFVVVPGLSVPVLLDLLADGHLLTDFSSLQPDDPEGLIQEAVRSCLVTAGAPRGHMEVCLPELFEPLPAIEWPKRRPRRKRGDKVSKFEEGFETLSRTPGAVCLSDGIQVAFLEDRLCEEQRQERQAHLVFCAYCLERQSRLAKSATPQRTR